MDNWYHHLNNDNAHIQEIPRDYSVDDAHIYTCTNHILYFKEFFNKVIASFCLFIIKVL